MPTNWPRNFINAEQGSDERKTKYAIARLHDINWSMSQRMRDWRWNKILRFFGYQSISDLIVASGVKVQFYLDEAEATEKIE